MMDCLSHEDTLNDTALTLVKLWKILKEMGITYHLTCLLKIYMQVRKQQLKLDMEQQTGSK